MVHLFLCPLSKVSVHRHRTSLTTDNADTGRESTHLLTLVGCQLAANHQLLTTDHLTHQSFNHCHSEINNRDERWLLINASQALFSCDLTWGTRLRKRDWDKVMVPVLVPSGIKLSLAMPTGWLMFDKGKRRWSWTLGSYDFVQLWVFGLMILRLIFLVNHLHLNF